MQIPDVLYWWMMLNCVIHTSRQSNWTSYKSSLVHVWSYWHSFTRIYLQLLIFFSDNTLWLNIVIIIGPSQPHLTEIIMWVTDLVCHTWKTIMMKRITVSGSSQQWLVVFIIIKYYALSYSIVGSCYMYKKDMF